MKKLCELSLMFLIATISAFADKNFLLELDNQTDKLVFVQYQKLRPICVEDLVTGESRCTTEGIEPSHGTMLFSSHQKKAMCHSLAAEGWLKLIRISDGSSDVHLEGFVLPYDMPNFAHDETPLVSKIRVINKQGALIAMLVD